MSYLYLIYSEKFTKIGFMPKSLFEEWKQKYFFFLDLIEKSPLKKHVIYKAPENFSEEVLHLAHTGKYISKVKSTSKYGGYLDFGETFMYCGGFKDALFIVSATLTAGKYAVEHNAISFNPCGGYHHAHTNSASGFCVFNDIVILAKKLMKDFKKIAIVDIDLHHGDGTQHLLYNKPILKISMHAYGIFPGSGDVTEIGVGSGEGYSINIPLKPRSGDDAALYGLDNVIIPAIEAYSPEIIIAQMGVDGHKDDYMQGLRLTYNFYKRFGNFMNKATNEITNGRFVGLDGGGYNPKTAAKGWIVMLEAINGYPPKIDLGEPTMGGLDYIKRKIAHLKELVTWF